MRSKTRTLSLNYSTDIPVIHTDLSQRNLSRLTSSPTTSKFSNEAALEDESSTRLSPPNSKPRSKLIPTKINEILNNLSNNSNLHASKEVLLQRCFLIIIPIRHTVPAKSLLLTPTNPFLAHTTSNSGLPTPSQPNKNMALEKSLQQASIRLFFASSNPKVRYSRHNKKNQITRVSQKSYHMTH